MIPDPLKDWYADESKQKELDEVLRTPILQEAMLLLQTVSLPKPDFSTKSSAETITDAAMEQKRNAGFFSYPDHLWQLTEKPTAPVRAPEGYSESYVKAWAKRHGYLDVSEEQEQQP